MTEGRPDGQDDSEMRSDPARSWSLYLEPGPGNSCRLLLRGCLELPREPSLAARIGGMVEECIDFVMEQRMLRTIRRLAES
jgi:hypothetical protein